MAPKTLLVFCDGTGMDGTLAPPRTGLEDPVGAGTVQFATNVLRLSRSVKSIDANGNRQLVFYQSGVGSESNFSGDPVTGTTAMQAFGTAVASKIRDAYVFLAQNFEAEEDDQICVFGFSRGAYTARKLSGLIDRIGLLPRHELGFFFEIWLQLINKETPTIPPDTRRPNIKCIGVWDTVGSVYNEIDALNIADTSLPKTVKVALHAVSLQENRKKFLPTLWSIPQGGLQPGQILKQVWFAGAHSDVGGGYERHELADISLYWMAGEITSLIDLDLDFLRSFAQVRPAPWGTSQPHNAYKETPAAQRIIIGHETRLESGQIVRQSVFHDSLKNSPQQLTSPDYMTTMSLIAQSFGAGFAPQYPPLNTFEKYCKDHWGRGLTRSHGNEDPGIVIRSTVRWIRPEAGLTPPDAVMGYGLSERDEPYCVGRVLYQGGLYPGAQKNNGIWITHEGITKFIPGPGYEVLIGKKKTRWVEGRDNFSLGQLNGAVPVQGGRDPSGNALFIAEYPEPRPLCGRIKENDLARRPVEPEGTPEFITRYYHVLVFV